MSRGLRWTAEQDALIACPTRPFPEIAKDIGRTVGAIFNRRAQKGWTHNLPPSHRAVHRHRHAPAPFKNADFVKPELQVAREEPAIRRPCLSCRQTFTTTRFVFVCDGCKKTESWRCAT